MHAHPCLYSLAGQTLTHRERVWSTSHDEFMNTMPLFFSACEQKLHGANRWCNLSATAHTQWLHNVLMQSLPNYCSHLVKHAHCWLCNTNSWCEVDQTLSPHVRVWPARLLLVWYHANKALLQEAMPNSRQQILHNPYPKLHKWHAHKLSPTGYQTFDLRCGQLTSFGWGQLPVADLMLLAAPVHSLLVASFGHIPYKLLNLVLVLSWVLLFSPHFMPWKCYSAHLLHNCCAHLM